MEMLVIFRDIPNSLVHHAKLKTLNTISMRILLSPKIHVVFIRIFSSSSNLTYMVETNQTFMGILAAPPKATPPRNKALLRAY